MIDVRGLSCPQPVMEVAQTLKNNEEFPLVVLANEAHTVKNIENYAKDHGYKTTVKETGLEYEINIQKG